VLPNLDPTRKRKFRKYSASPAGVILWSTGGFLTIVLVTILIFLNPKLTNLMAKFFNMYGCNASLVLGSYTFEVRILKTKRNGYLEIPKNPLELVSWVKATNNKSVFVISPTIDNLSLISDVKAGDIATVTSANCKTTSYILSLAIPGSLNIPTLFDQPATGITIIMPFENGTSGFLIHGEFKNEIYIFPTFELMTQTYPETSKGSDTNLIIGTMTQIIPVITPSQPTFTQVSATRISPFSITAPTLYSPVASITQIFTSTNTGIPPTPQTTSTPIIPTIDPTTGRPGYLQSIIDTISGSIITRVVDDSWGAICRHHYSKDQAWNADQTVIWLNKGCDKFIDGNTYALLPNLKTPPDSGGESRWSPIDRNVIIYTSGSVLGKWNPFTGTGVIIRTFSGYSSLSIGEGEGNMSNDGKFIALYSDVSNIGFAYDMVNNIKYPDINFGSDVLKSLSMSSLGNYLIANINNDNAKIFNLQGVQVGNTWSEYGCPSHYDFTVDQNGDEVAVGVCKTGYKGIVKRRLADGQITVIFPMGASHTSARNIKRPGWVYVSGLYYAPYLNDVLAIKIDGTGFEIIANVPWIDDGIYESERHASPSLDGTKVIIATNWGIYDGSSQSFVIKTNK
jgi:hypothetical protein